MRLFCLRCLSAGFVLLLAAGCSSTQQIRTAPPQSAVPPPEEARATETHAFITVVVETGATALPDDVQTLQFRIDEVQLKQAAGAWTSYPADINSFMISARARPSKPVLSTQVPPASYDSLALSFSDIFVLFDANAGGPLTMARGTPLKLPITTHLALGRQTTIRLVFEPGASLTQGRDRRWYLVPFFETLVD